jgi:hypothetical protein
MKANLDRTRNVRYSKPGGPIVYFIKSPFKLSLFHPGGSTCPAAAMF